MWLQLLFFSALAIAQSLEPVYDQAVRNYESQTSVASLDPVALRQRFFMWPTTATPYLSCSTKLLAITDAVSKYPVSCTLAVRPNSSVTIFLEAYGVKFDTCYLHFTKTTWSTAQTFNVLPTMSLLATQDTQTYQIYMLAFTLSETYNNKTFILPFTRSTRQAATCSVNGDPHIQTIGSGSTRALSYFGQKSYTLIESTAGLRVLGAYSVCNSKNMTCLAGVQVQYNLATYSVSFVQRTTAATIAVSNIGTNTDGTSVKMASDNKSFTITLQDSTVISIIIHFSVGDVIYGGNTPPFNFLDLHIVISPVHYQKVSGQCGVWDDAIDPLVLVCGGRSWDRSSPDNIKQWGDCWETQNFGVAAPLASSPALTTVPQLCQIPLIAAIVEAPPCPSVREVNTFGYQPAWITGASGYAFPSDASVPQATGYLAPTGYVVEASGYAAPPGYVPNPTGYSAPSGPSLIPCTITPTAALEMCTKSIEEVPGCSTLCDLKVYVGNCVADVLSTCSLVFCSTHRNSYVHTCGTMAGLLVNSPDATASSLGLSVQEVVGCPPSPTSGNINKITDFKVKSCEPGFGGLDCKVSFDMTVHIATNDTNAATKIPITKELFKGILFNGAPINVPQAVTAKSLRKTYKVLPPVQDDGIGSNFDDEADSVLYAGHDLSTGTLLDMPVEDSALTSPSGAKKTSSFFQPNYTLPVSTKSSSGSINQIIGASFVILVTLLLLR